MTTTEPLSLAAFTARGDEKPLLRISTAGSVDDGKSTLIGRLLYDTKTVWDDHIEDIRKSTVNRASRGIDLSLLTDGLRAEREQGITIDVAYRYFSTPRRQFIVADTPGHEQYTRNMATGASTCDLAIILLDARKGVLEQSRRHARIAWLLGVRRLVFTVNKMDLVDFSLEVFEEIRAQVDELTAEFDGAVVDFVPISALDGDNVVAKSERTPWYAGPSLLELLETAEPPVRSAELSFRFPVQLVIRPHLDFRGFAGQIASGRVRAGDEVVALPSGRRSRVKRIVTFDGDLAEAVAPMSVTLELEDEIDISRGDLLAHPASAPKLGRRLATTVVWMNEEPLDSRRGYLLQHLTRVVPVRLHGVAALNEIARVEVELAEPLPYEHYRENRATGGFILIDAITNLTVGAGLVEGEAASGDAARVRYSGETFTPAERRKLRALLAHMERFGVQLGDEDFEEGEGI